MRCSEALPEANIRNGGIDCVSRDFDLGRMCPKELNVQVSVVKKEGDNEAPNFPSALQLIQLVHPADWRQAG